jgi:hypothetical protein
MLTQAIWWSSFILEALLIFRSFATKLRIAFPIFYSYLATVCITSISRICVYEMHPSSYPEWYWVTEIFTAIIGYGVIFEMYDRVLVRFQGVARFLKVILLCALCIAVISTFSTAWSLHGLTSRLENNIRLIQAVLLFALLALLGHYRIPLAKSTKGIIVGYALFVGFMTIQSVFLATFGDRFLGVFRHLNPLVYLSSLVIWSASLWSNYPEPAIEIPRDIEHDYDSLVAATRMTLSRARAYVARGVR